MTYLYEWLFLLYLYITFPKRERKKWVEDVGEKRDDLCTDLWIKLSKRLCLWSRVGNNLLSFQTNIRGHKPLSGYQILMVAREAILICFWMAQFMANSILSRIVAPLSRASPMFHIDHSFAVLVAIANRSNNLDTFVKLRLFEVDILSLRMNIWNNYAIM